MHLLDMLLPELYGRVNLVIYDTALTGWMPRYLMARHGVLLVSWPVKRQATSSLAEEYRLEVEEALHRRGIDPAKDRNLVDHLVEKKLERHPDDRIPQGRSKRVSPGTHRVSWVDSDATPFRTLTHRAVGTGQCAHDLWIEDGEMWDVETHATLGASKIRPVRCIDATVSGNRTLGHRLHLRLVLDCPAQRQEWSEYWAPPLKRGPLPRAAAQHPALDLYNPINPHSPYWSTYFRRSDAEAAQKELKQRLGPYGRAASLTPEHQLLDAHAVDCLTSSRTWYAFKIHQL